MRKNEFVEQKLRPLLCALDDEILAVTYGKVADKERVYVIFEGGYLEIDVSGRDNADLTWTVANRLLRK